MLNMIISKRKYIFFISLLSIILLSSCNLFTKSSGSTNTTSSQNFTIYNNSTYKIKFKYPDNWIIKLDSKNVIELKDPGTLDPVNDVFFYLAFHPLPFDSINTLEELTQKKLNDLKHDNYVFLISEATTLSNVPAYKVVYTTNKGLYKVMEIWAVKNNTAYIIMCMGEINRYSLYSKDIQEMVDSIEIN